MKANAKAQNIYAPVPIVSINLARIDLVSMRLLLECAAAGSISAAAPRCNLSVMGASGRLRRLETALGKRLFYRRRDGVELTEAGIVVLRSARTLLDVVQLMFDDVLATTVPALEAPENFGRGGAVKPPPFCGAGV